MGVASLILGICSLLIGLIPGCGIIALLPAVIGLLLGIAFVVGAKKRNEPAGNGVAGAVLSAISVLVIIVWTTIIFLSSKDAHTALQDSLETFPDSVSAMKDSLANEINKELGEILEDALDEVKETIEK